ncbi:uncharacterized protein LOC132545461 [Ylistrum balloti]|uniref:uncharacterized protein LOC132545461 n=1 Tax=Ylistrum balloti TaxID=509963 RepID=UPI002905BF81|nr:uncharacterized protein LOC132545461 [Ylistrum balloti]
MTDEEDFEPESIIVCQTDRGTRTFILSAPKHCHDLNQREIPDADIHLQRSRNMEDIKNVIAFNNARCAKQKEDSTMEEFKKDGDPCVMDWMKKIQENDFKGKSKRSITIKDEKSDLKEEYSLVEKSDGAEKETSEEKVFPVEKNEKDISKLKDMFKNNKSLDKKLNKKWNDQQMYGRGQKSNDVVKQSQDNRYASSEGVHGEMRVEDETPVKELVFVAVENEHTFESLQSNASICLMTRTDELDENQKKNDPDKDDDEAEKTDQVKPEEWNVADVEFPLNLESLEYESLNDKRLRIDSLNEDNHVPSINISRNSTTSPGSDDFLTLSELLNGDEDKDTDCSIVNLDKNGKKVLSSSSLDTSWSSALMEMNGKIEEDFDQRISLDKNSLQSGDLENADTSCDDDVEKEQLVKLYQEGKEVSGEIDDIENGSDCTEDRLNADLEVLTQKKSTLLSICRRELNDIKNLCLMMTNSILPKCTEEMDTTTEVSLLKGDNSFSSLEEKQFFEVKELEELTGGSQNEKEQLDIFVADLSARQCKVYQGLSMQLRTEKKLKKKLKQLEAMFLEECSTTLVTPGKPTIEAVFTRLETKDKVTSMPWNENFPLKKEKWMSGLLRAKHYSQLPFSGSQTFQGLKCKGDTLKRQPTDSESSCQGNGFGESGGNQKSSNDRNGNKEGDNKENARNFDDEKDMNKQEHSAEGNKNETPTAENPTNNPAPAANFKYRKKEEEERQMDTYLKLVELKEDIPPDIMKEIDKCLVACLNSRKIGGSDVVSDCSICALLYSLISHFGNCPSDYNNCDRCQRAFCLVSKHLQLCMESRISEMEEVCTLKICQKIQNKFKKQPEKISQRGKELWPKLKKYLARFSRGPEDISMDEGDDFFSLSSIPLGSIGGLPSRVSRNSIVFQQNLESISENTTARHLTGSRSEPFARKSETGEILHSRTFRPRPSRLSVTDESKSPYPGQSRSAPLARKTEGKIMYSLDPDTLPKSERRVSFSNNQVEVHTVRYPLSPEEPLQSIAETAQCASLNTEKVYGGDRTSSLPSNFFPPNKLDDEQLISVQMRPSGYPGIGEVVYAFKEQLRYVARHWKKIKENFEKDKTLEKKHLREEGVILTENKDKFSIFRTRYQKNFQWIRLTHLGTGMSGKCHLAQDYYTDFKFCIKKIHILKFDERELDIWSDLSHPNIVQLYGALRHGHNIYIVEEFIDGGCLTETINLQKETGHRLSHWTAMNYLEQILTVLVYLEKRSIIHEDIKADNILLRKGTTKIVVTDFGVARRLEHALREVSPVGTPTSFSPEKAKGQGHGARSDVWAAICVLIHMLSGWPPWVRRYGGVSTLNFIIADREPPIKDLPGNVSRDVYKLVEDALKKDPKARPSASQLLKHEAFDILTGGSAPETFVSVLEPRLNTDIKISNDVDQAVIDEVKVQYQPQNMLSAFQNATADSKNDSSGTESTSTLTPGSTVSHCTGASKAYSSWTGNDCTKTTQGARPKTTRLDLLPHGSIGSAKPKPKLDLPSGGFSGLGGGEIQTSMGMVTPCHPPTVPQTTRNLPPSYHSDISEFGVMGPPDPAKYIQIDQETIFRKYINDDGGTGENLFQKYKTILELYEPDPESNSDSGEDINDTLQKLDRGFTNIPDFQKLLGTAVDNDYQQERASMPDIVHQMVVDALKYNMKDASGEIINRNANGALPISYDRSAEEGQEEQEEEVTHSKEMPNFGSLLSERQDTNSNNENLPFLPTVLNSLDDQPTLTDHKSSASENSIQEGSESGEDLRTQNVSSSTEDVQSSGKEESLNRIQSDPSNSLQELDPNDSSYQNPMPDARCIIPDFDNLMSSSPFIEEENIPIEDLFGSGDEETVKVPTIIKFINDVTSTGPVKKYTEQLLVITDKSTGAITKTKTTPLQPVTVEKGRVPVESNELSLSPTKSPSPVSPRISTPLGSPPFIKHNKKQLHLNLSPSKRKTDRQTSEPQQHSSQYKSPNPREVKPYFTPQQQITSPPSWRTGNTPPKSGGTSSAGKSDSKLEQQNKENENKIAEYFEEISRHSENSKSQIDELDDMSDPDNEDISIANDDEEEYMASLKKIQMEYVSPEIKKSDSQGALVRVITSEKELFHIKLQGEHILNSWEVIIDKELSDKLTAENISNFILVDTNGEPLDLTENPCRGEQTVYVREPDNNSPWSCRDTVIHKASFF